MAVTKDINSYCSLEEAESYFENRLDVAAWEEASEDEKGKALVTATMLLDNLEWSGVMATDTQTLAFPRIGEFLDSRKGWVVQMDPTPARVQQAQKELAYHLLNNDGLLDDTGSVTSLKIGSSINLERIGAASGLPPIVKTLIRPMLYNQGRREVWRAN
jgi:hypothetical protein